MMKFKIFLPVAVIAIVLLAGCQSSGNRNLLTVTDSGKIEPLGEMFHDWKDINIKGGNVEHAFKFKNAGDKELVIKTATTSCMCTSAKVTVGEKSSPQFGMHNQISWGYPVKPGQEFVVNVVFDPMAHGPDAVGPINRSIYLMTSSVPNGTYAVLDPRSNQMVTEMRAQAMVLSESDYQKKNDNGPTSNDASFTFKETEYDFGVVKQSGGLVSYDFQFIYSGKNPINITGTPTSCACTSAEISPKQLKNGENGILKVTFDPNLHEEPHGKFFKTISVMTEPKLAVQPEVKIWAEIDLDLGEEAYKLKEPHEEQS